MLTRMADNSMDLKSAIRQLLREAPRRTDSPRLHREGGEPLCLLDALPGLGVTTHATQVYMMLCRMLNEGEVVCDAAQGQWRWRLR